LSKKVKKSGQNYRKISQNTPEMRLERLSSWNSHDLPVQKFKKSKKAIKITENVRKHT
jgi:hypothetical protein